MGRRQIPLFDRSETMSPPAAIPSPPKSVTSDPAAAAEWDRITNLLLREGVVAELDQAALSLYCCSYSRWQRAMEQLSETGGEVILNERGEPQQNPWLDVVNQAARYLSHAALPLGLSPAARSKVKLPGSNAPASTALDEFLNE